jgi:transaldolase/glucose-6-phosphate isomerase
MAEADKSAVEIYEALAITDIQSAADVLATVYEKTGGTDGFVSLECSPLLAHDTAGTIQEARRLWQALARPNVMIKIPGTAEGIPAIEECIYEGININITLLFSLESYEQTMTAYLRGLGRRAAEGKAVDRVSSVASFFVSRIDTAVDRRLEKLIGEADSDQQRNRFRALLGRVAIANAKMAHQRFKQVFHGQPFAELRARGAQVQRPLWASTSTKNPAYRDVYYVEALIGRETINTLPPQTLAAFRDHGQVRLTIEEDLDEARALVEQLRGVGIDLDDVTRDVLSDGVRLFIEPFEKLIQSIDKQREEIRSRARATDSAAD